MINTEVRVGNSWTSMVAGNLHLLRWTQTPTLLDVQNVTREVERTHHQLARPMVCIAVIPTDVEPPMDDARKRMLADLDRLLKVSTSVHFVVEGSGFKHVMLRSVVTGLILVAGRRGRIFVHGKLEDALKGCGDTLSASVAAILATARTRGIAL